MIATLLSARAALEVAPLVVIAVVFAYLASEVLSAYVDARKSLKRARAVRREGSRNAHCAGNMLAR